VDDIGDIDALDRVALAAILPYEPPKLDAVRAGRAGGDPNALDWAWKLG
jgi:hypothetical protein